MRLELTTDDCAGFSEDRDGIAAFYPEHMRQGFNLYFAGAGMTIHFEDERDAVNVAKAILLRMGETT